MSIRGGFSWATADEVNKLLTENTNQEIAKYVNDRKDERSYLYRFEVERLSHMLNKESRIDTVEVSYWEPRAREKKCMDFRWKIVCPFQPSALLEHIGDGHL